MIEIVKDPLIKQSICRTVLESLPEWFGIPESREQYIAESANQHMACAFEAGTPIGFLCLKQTGDATVELAVMGVMKRFHRQGIGRSLFETARQLAIESGFSFMQVKTVKMGLYSEYDATNHFYIALGFREFELFPTLWDENNPCQIYVMHLK